MAKEITEQKKIVQYEKGRKSGYWLNERGMKERMTWENPNDIGSFHYVMVEGIQKYIFKVDGLYATGINEVSASLKCVRYMDILVDPTKKPFVLGNELVYLHDQDRFRAFWCPKEPYEEDTEEVTLATHQVLPGQCDFILKITDECKYLEGTGNERRVLVPIKYLRKHPSLYDDWELKVMKKKKKPLKSPYTPVSLKELTWVERVFQVFPIVFFLAMFIFILLDIAATWDFVTGYDPATKTCRHMPSAEFGKDLLWTMAIVLLPSLPFVTLFFLGCFGLTSLTLFAVCSPGLACAFMTACDWLTGTAYFYDECWLLWMWCMAGAFITYPLLLFAAGAALSMCILNMFKPDFLLSYYFKTLFYPSRYKKYIFIFRFFKEHDKFKEKLIKERMSKYDDSFWQ